MLLFSLLLLSLLLQVWSREMMRFGRSTHRASALRRFASQGSSVNGEEYCRDLVRSKDYESFLIGLLFPSEHRRAYFAIRAFNVEIATIREQVPRAAQQAGKMRFQFWRDILQSLSQQRQLQSFMRQPVAQELQYLVTKYDHVTVRWLERSLEAR